MYTYSVATAGIVYMYNWTQIMNGMVGGSLASTVSLLLLDIKYDEPHTMITLIVHNYMYMYVFS